MKECRTVLNNFELVKDLLKNNDESEINEIHGWSHTCIKSRFNEG